MSTSFLCERAYQITNAKAYIFSDSVLCVGKMGDDLIATRKSKIKWYSENNHFKELNRIDGMPTEFECHLHVNVQRHCMARKKERQKDVNKIHRQLRLMLANSLTVIGLSWGLDQKRNGTEPLLTNLTDDGTKLQST